MPTPVRVVGLGGSLRHESTSRTALQTALDGVLAAGAQPRLISVRDLDLPMYSSERVVPPAARELAEVVYSSDALIWSTPTYHGSVSGSFKNALDWLILLAERDPPYLTNKPVGLVATAGGVQGLQSVNSMDFIVRALRGWMGASWTRWWRRSCASLARRSSERHGSSRPKGRVTTPIAPSSRRMVTSSLPAPARSGDGCTLASGHGLLCSQPG
jgi:NAD(P)H-dependent FMN reductase